jgi:hypothetical protein
MQFVEINTNGEAHAAGPAPFLDYQPLEPELGDKARKAIEADWLKTDIEDEARSYAIQHLVPEHLSEISARREKRIERTEVAVKARLTTEINYWDRRAEDLKAQERAGKKNARLNSTLARRRADDLQNRLQNRMQQLSLERKLSPQPPVLIGGALVIPAGLIAKLQGEETTEEAITLFGENRRQVELAAMQAVIAYEQSLGFKPVDVSAKKLPWDIESYVGDGTLRFIEVKGRIEDATTVTISKNEILTGLNKPEEFILAIVKVDFEGEEAHVKEMHYVSNPFSKEPDFGATSVNYSITDLLINSTKVF